MILSKGRYTVLETLTCGSELARQKLEVGPDVYSKHRRTECLLLQYILWGKHALCMYRIPNLSSIFHNLSKASRVTPCVGSQSIKGTWRRSTELYLNNTIQQIFTSGMWPAIIKGWIHQFYMLKRVITGLWDYYCTMWKSSVKPLGSREPVCNLINCLQ